MKLVDAALKYAEKGIYVFPTHNPEEHGCSCKDGAGCDNIAKHPRVLFKTEASINPAIIRGWWDKWPLAGIGIPAEQNGLAFIDVDNRESFESEVASFVPGARSTWESVSGSGRGSHYWFRGDIRNTQSGELAPGVDTRGRGGFILAPPSLHASGGKYRWVRAEGEIPPFPPELVSRLSSKPSRASQGSSIDEGPIPPGSRHAYYCSVAGKLRDVGLGPDDILRTITEINARRSPDHDLKDLEAIAASYGSKDARSVDQVVGSYLKSPLTAQAHKLFGGVSAEGKKKLKLTTYNQVVREDLEWLFEGYIPISGFTLLYGAPGKGKSYLTVGLAADISNGTPLPNTALAMGVTPKNVLLFAYEDDAATVVSNRLRACGADMARVHTLLPDDGEFTHRELSLLEEAIEDIGNVGVVIIDPLTAWSAGIDDNSETQVRPALGALHRLGQKLRVPILGVKHTNKMQGGSNRIAGSRAWEAVARSAVLAGHDNEREFVEGITYGGIVQTKLNLGPASLPLTYKIDHGRFVWTGVDKTLTVERLLEKPKKDEK